MKIVHGCIAFALVTGLAMPAAAAPSNSKTTAKAKTTKKTTKAVTTVKPAAGGAAAEATPGPAAKKGVGKAQMPIPGSPSTPTVIRISFECNSDVSYGCEFTTLKADGSNAGLQSAALGPYKGKLVGSYLVNYFGGPEEAATSMQIQAKAWTVDFVPLTAVRAVSSGQTITGVGGEVLAVKGAVSVGTVKGGGGPEGEYLDLRSYSISDGKIEETFVAQTMNKEINGPITIPDETRYLAFNTRTPWTLTLK